MALIARLRIFLALLLVVLAIGSAQAGLDIVGVETNGVIDFHPGVLVRAILTGLLQAVVACTALVLLLQLFQSVLLPVIKGRIEASRERKGFERWQVEDRKAKKAERLERQKQRFRDSKFIGPRLPGRKGSGTS